MALLTDSEIVKAREGMVQKIVAFHLCNNDCNCQIKGLSFFYLISYKNLGVPVKIVQTKCGCNSLF